MNIQISSERFKELVAYEIRVQSLEAKVKLAAEKFDAIAEYFRENCGDECTGCGAKYEDEGPNCDEDCPWELAITGEAAMREGGQDAGKTVV